MRIALVGGAGFIGHNLALSLDHEVMVADNLMVNNLYALDKESRYRRFIDERMTLLRRRDIPFFPVDARDYHALTRALAPFRPEVIIHLAAVAHLDRSQKDPFSTFDHSLRTLENTLDIAKALGSRVVYFSSSTVYGDFSKPTIDETEPLKPKSIYGSLKLCGEALCRACSDAYGIPVTIIRPIALYGPRCVSGRVTQVFVENAMSGRPLKIHGGDIAQDFTWVGDLSRAVSLVVKSEKNETYNVASEQSTTLARLAEIVTSRYPVPVEFLDADPLKPRRGAVSCEKIRRDLGYIPETDIETGMNKYMDWYQETGLAVSVC